MILNILICMPKHILQIKDNIKKLNYIYIILKILNLLDLSQLEIKNLKLYLILVVQIYGLIQPNVKIKDVKNTLNIHLVIKENIWAML